MDVKRCTAALVITACMAAPVVPAAASDAGPHYDFDRRQLESILDDLKAWLPGAWDSFPQIYYERTVRMPDEGEHEHWHRTFALIDAPQVGETVFYGQINMGGRSGPILGRSQVLYKAVLDEARGVVSITGQPIPEPDRFQNLHERPELWPEVRMRDESAVHCDFIWRRDGRQLFGVLEGRKSEWNKYGPGTCNYISRSGQEFYADAEWVLTPEELWLYDLNTIAGAQFIGRQDRTHIRLYRTLPYNCEIVTDAGGQTMTVAGHDRGFAAGVSANDAGEREMFLLRAYYPPASGPGLVDELRLMIRQPGGGEIYAQSAAEPRADYIVVESGEISASCRRAAAFPPMEIRD